MAAFDARETGYVRIEVPPAEIEPVSWQRLPERGRIWIYRPASPHDAPTSTFPVLQSYIDIVLRGALDYGEDYARELLQTTTGWNEFWLNDRERPRRPWVFDKEYAQVDKLLSTQIPHYQDRLFPEQYAIDRVLKPR